jgi:hypothetical protein
MLTKSVPFRNETNECKWTWVMANTGRYSKWWHVEFHLIAYNQTAPCIFCVADYLGAMCRPRHVALHHVHLHCENCHLVSTPTAPLCRQSTAQIIGLLYHAPAYPTTPSSTHRFHLETALPHLCRKFSCSIYVVFYSKDQMPFFFYLRIYFPFVV